MIEPGTFIRVRCIDNTLQNDVLEVGREYEVLRVNERDDYYELCGLGQFSRRRFVVNQPT